MRSTDRPGVDTSACACCGADLAEPEIGAVLVLTAAPAESWRDGVDWYPEGSRYGAQCCDFAREHSGPSCTRCEGSGRIEGGDGPAAWIDDCPECHGTGINPFEFAPLSGAVR